MKPDKIYGVVGKNALFTWNTLYYVDGKVLLKGMQRSFMQKENRYLLFLSARAIYKCFKEKVYEEDDIMWSGCYNIENDCYETVASKNAIYNKNADYFSSNKKMVNAYIEAKHLLMKKYGIE